MESNYTVNKLIQLIYGECDIFDRLELEDALENDDALRLEYSKMKSGYLKLPKVKFSPSNQTIRNIIGFSSNQLGATA